MFWKEINTVFSAFVVLIYPKEEKELSKIEETVEKEEFQPL